MISWSRGLFDFAMKYPNELSGGMQQRVAICRALLCQPTLLLMDEPFAALDAMTREELSVELLRIWQHEPKTVLFVTHSISEAILLADQVVIIGSRPGRVVRTIDVEISRPRDLSADAIGRLSGVHSHNPIRDSQTVLVLPGEAQKGWRNAVRHRHHGCSSAIRRTATNSLKSEPRFSSSASGNQRKTTAIAFRPHEWRHTVDPGRFLHCRGVATSIRHTMGAPAAAPCRNKSQRGRPHDPR